MNRKYREAFFEIINSCCSRLKSERLLNSVKKSTENKAQQTDGGRFAQETTDKRDNQQAATEEPWVGFKTSEVNFGDLRIAVSKVVYDENDEMNDDDGREQQAYLSTTVAEISGGYPERKRGSSNTTTTTIRTSSLPSDHSPIKENFRIV
ncbi:uncharacterized protein LOC142357815 [Convolutriloba macropyga]|uniref:uncharacterized protein LOC142357815 n=1 Tax=Convolutriloba macropyga TaxID=536237 RepID=UPI003F528865